MVVWLLTPQVDATSPLFPGSIKKDHDPRKQHQPTTTDFILGSRMFPPPCCIPEMETLGQIFSIFCYFLMNLSYYFFFILIRYDKNIIYDI